MTALPSDDEIVYAKPRPPKMLRTREIPPLTPSDVERFESRIMKVIDGCWLWTGTADAKGYGHFWMQKKLFLAHRVSYTHFVEVVPPGLTLDHLCRTTACVNPLHLEAVTQQENARRGVSVIAKRFASMHCAKGHVFTKVNTHFRTDGTRYCRECSRAAYRLRSEAFAAGMLTVPEKPEGVCVNGHAWDETAMFVTTKIRWACRVCRREAGRRHDQKRRARSKR